jgi:hypothetical protein
MLRGSRLPTLLLIGGSIVVLFVWSVFDESQGKRVEIRYKNTVFIKIGNRTFDGSAIYRSKIGIGSGGSLDVVTSKVTLGESIVIETGGDRPKIFVLRFFTSGAGINNYPTFCFGKFPYSKRLLFEKYKNLKIGDTCSSQNYYGNNKKHKLPRPLIAVFTNADNPASIVEMDTDAFRAAVGGKAEYLGYELEIVDTTKPITKKMEVELPWLVNWPPAGAKWTTFSQRRASGNASDVTLAQKASPHYFIQEVTWFQDAIEKVGNWFKW